MPNRVIPKIDIRKDVIVKAMREKKMGYRPLGEKVGMSERNVRAYVNSGRMPAFLAGRLCRELDILPSRILARKSIWMRIGVTVPMDDEELRSFLEYADGEQNIGERLAGEFLERAIADGDSYVPENCLMEALNE